MSKVNYEREADNWLVDKPSTSKCIKRKGGEPRRVDGKIEENKFKCHEANCQYSTNHKARFKRHAIIHSAEKPYNCDVCAMQFKSLRNMKRHRRRQAAQLNRNFECDFCDAKYCFKKHLNHHKRIMHLNDELKCNLCDLRTRSAIYFKRHLSKHLGKKEIKCGKCDFSCHFKKGLFHHLQAIHSKTKPLPCHYPNCQFSTIFKKNLERHKKYAHSTEKPFKCCQCERAFKYKFNLKQHSLQHTNRKPLQCEKGRYSLINKNKSGAHTLIRKSIVAKERVSDDCGLMLSGQSDSRVHLDALKPCYVPLNMPVSLIVKGVDGRPFLRAIFELKDDVVKNILVFK